MQTLKMTISTISLLMLIVCFTMATPMVQQKKTTPSDKTTNQITPLSKPDKKLNFIQKFIFKKMEKKVKKAFDEDEYRKQARLSVIFGVLAPIPYMGIFFMIISVILGATALKSKDKKTRRLAIIGIVLAVLLSLVGIGIIHFINTIPSFCFAPGC